MSLLMQLVSMVAQKELVLYPNKNGCVRDLLEEARKQVTTSPDVGSGRLRYAVLLPVLELRWFSVVCHTTGFPLSCPK